MRLGARSSYNLATCAKQLQNIIGAASCNKDFAVIEGYVSRFEQNKRGFPWPTLPENRIPSKSVKIVPTPHSVSDRYVWGVVKEIAKAASEAETAIHVKVINGVIIVTLPEFYEDQAMIDTTSSSS